MKNAVSMMAMGSFLAEKIAAGTDSRRALFKRLGMAEPDDTLPAHFAVDWHACGFPRVHIGHKHAAALMATNTPPEPAGLREAWAAWFGEAW